MGDQIRVRDTYHSVIHEILFALNGYNGSFFEMRGNILQVNEDLPLAPSEKVLINRILLIATHYKRIKEFIKKHTVLENMANSSTSSSVFSAMEPYILALCSGLNEVLEPYCASIVTMEKCILADPHQSVSYVLSVVDEFACLLKILNVILDQMDAFGDKLNSCCILELLHRNSLSAVANVQVAIQRIQCRCNEVLFKQLSAWLFQGHLSEHQHFFIQKNSFDSSEDEVEFIEEIGGPGLYAAYKDFKLNSSLLPSYIPFPLACKILYVGQTVVMIQQNLKNTLDKPSLDIESDKPASDVWGGREMEFLQELQTMQSDEKFQLDRLTWLVDATRLCVTQHLWSLAMTEARLMDEVKLIKDLYLLGRGELFLEFIRLADATLSAPPTRLTLKEANQLLRTAARNIHLDEESLLVKFCIFFDSSAGQSGWDCLNLSFTVQWPLHLLLTKEASVDYNHLFRFLLRVRRTQRELHSLWKCQMQKKLLAGCEENPDLWQLRRNLTFVVDNLQHYLQVDVLESQYSIFMEAINTTDNFEEVIEAHSRALASIMSQSFLHRGKHEKVKKTEPCKPYEQNPVIKCLIALLDLSFEFCSCAQSLENGHVILDIGDKLKAIDDTFIKQVGLLKQLLVGLRGLPSGTALSQLLLRLDFNNWISENCVSIDRLVI